MIQNPILNQCLSNFEKNYKDYFPAKKTGYYLAYEKEWSIKHLNFLQQLLRNCFGFYKETHSYTIRNAITTIPDAASLYPHLHQKWVGLARGASQKSTFLRCVNRDPKAEIIDQKDPGSLGECLSSLNEHYANSPRQKSSYYLAYKEGWSVKHLNFFQQFLRNRFGFYKETHLYTIKNEIQKILDVPNFCPKLLRKLGLFPTVTNGKESISS